MESGHRADTFEFGLLLSFLDELVTLVVSVGEADHHHAVDDLLSLVLVQTTALFEHFLAQDVVDEVSHHDVHVGLAGCGKATVLHGLLPGNEVALLKSEELVSVELVELIFEELGHDSEARSIEEEVELLVIFFSSGVGGTDLGHFAGLFGHLDVLWLLDLALFFRVHFTGQAIVLESYFRLHNCLGGRRGFDLFSPLSLGFSLCLTLSWFNWGLSSDSGWLDLRGFGLGLGLLDDDALGLRGNVNCFLNVLNFWSFAL